MVVSLPDLIWSPSAESTEPVIPGSRGQGQAAGRRTL